MVYTRPMLACLYDIHGNLPALEAVLADAEAQGASRWILGGDYALFGAWPRETVERLRGLDNAIWVRGNGERWTRDVDDAPDNPVVRSAIAFVRAALGNELVAGMADIELLAQDRGALICHASPPSDVRSFFPAPADDEAELLAGVSHRRVVFGHTHLPFRRISTVHEIELINPGSVGLPFDGDTRAAYALLHRDHTVEHRRVEYDHAAVATRLREIAEPWTERVAKRIEQARADV
ncbi:MAG TPA: metallophosphoesterase family protein [Solirubrobacteraceae bacterium]|nr:metallophosphoesterase family protein [Solirubrobacteraceae bacterium]